MSQTSKYESRNPIQVALVRQFLTSVAKAVLSTGKRNIADVGCADGYVYQFLRDHAGAPFDYIGYDVDLAALERAKARFPGIRFEPGSVYDVDTSADLVLCLEVLEHLTDPDKALKHLASLTACDFIVSVPHEPWFAFGNLARGRHIARLGNLPNHFNRWTKTRFNTQLRPWFEIVTDYSSFPWILYRLRKRTP